MATTLNPYLNFRGRTREAMHFYRDVLDGKLTIATFGESHASSDPSEDDLVMHADLEGPDGIRLMAADVPPRMDYQHGSDFSMSLSGDDDAELRGYFEKLSDGGTVLQPIVTAAWGDAFGMCTDRFGIRWLVNIAGPRD